MQIPIEFMIIQVHFKTIIKFLYKKIIISKFANSYEQKLKFINQNIHILTFIK